MYFNGGVNMNIELMVSFSINNDGEYENIIGRIIKIDSTSDSASVLLSDGTIIDNINMSDLNFIF